MSGPCVQSGLYKVRRSRHCDGVRLQFFLSELTKMKKSVSVAPLEQTMLVQRALALSKPLLYLTKEEVARFFACIPSSASRERLLFDLSYRHGLRRREAALLRLEHFSSDGKVWITRAKSGISGSYPLHPRSRELFDAYFIERRFDSCRYLFRGRRTRPEPISGSLIYQLFRSYAEAADLPMDRRHPHVLRHSIAVHLMNAGWDAADVQDWLGHASIATTMIYAAVSNQRREERFRSLLSSAEIAVT